MPPARRTQQALATPLNRILGSEGNVRILRELCSTGVPLGRADLAARTGLTLPGVGSALAKLCRTGVVERVGSGTRQAVRLRGEHPLSLALRSLFLAELARRDALVDELRGLVQRITPPPRSAWMHETAPDPDAPIALTVLVAAREVSRVREQVRAGLNELQRRFDVSIELRATTEADLATAGAEEAGDRERATVLAGRGPPAFRAEGATADSRKPRSRASSHRRRDEQALHAAAWLAWRLEHDPTLPVRARRWIVRRIHAGTPREANELTEWLDLLDTASIPRLQHVLLDPGERGTRLRQSNPLVPVLSDSEREAMAAAVAP